MVDVDASEQRERRLIVGLGNPGPRYRDTRHNLGFSVVYTLAKRRGVSIGTEECSSLFAQASDVDLALPQTFMNRSGFAVRCLVERRGYRAEDILVVYDDVNLPLGRLRMRPGGSPGGHRGMESIIENLQTDAVPRLRLGIAPPLDALEDQPGLVEFVLAPFAEHEVETAREETVRAADACEAWIDQGIADAMNRFNG